jgi:hypothetical protein
MTRAAKSQRMDTNLSKFHALHLATAISLRPVLKAIFHRRLNPWGFIIKNSLSTLSLLFITVTDTSRGSSVSIVAGVWAGRRWFDSRQVQGVFILVTASSLILGPSQPPIQRVPGALSLVVRQPGREADHSPPASAKVKNVWSYTSTPKYRFMAWCLIKQQIRLHGMVLS